MDTGARLTLTTAREEKPSLVPRRRRHTLIVTVVAVVAVVAMAIAWAASSHSSSSCSSTSSGDKSVSTKSSKSKASKSPFPRRWAIVALGDSCTENGGHAQGWEVLLHENYVRSADTINRGLGGYNTRLYLEHALPTVLDEMEKYYTPAVVLVWFGVNDATLEDGPNRAQHVPVAEYKQNLISMIQQIRATAPAARVVLLSPTYIDEDVRRATWITRGRNATAPLDRNNNATVQYAKACGEIKNETFARDTNVAYVDLYDYFVTNYPNRTEVLLDGIHFNLAGDRVFFELIKDQIESMLPKGLITNFQFPFETQFIHYDK